MPEPYFRLIHVAEDDAGDMEMMLNRIHAERPAMTEDARLLRDLADAIKNGVVYGGQHPKGEAVNG
jgi:hypothetical protein